MQLITKTQDLECAAGCCPVCQNVDFSADRFGLVRCVKCELVVDKRVWKVDLDKQLEKEWFEGSYKLCFDLWDRIFEFLNNSRTWRRLKQRALSKGHLLEIGVGSGSFLNFVRNKGLKVEGCDLSETLCKNLEEKHGIRTCYRGVDSIPADKHYDLIVMNHVLEHTSEPELLLSEVKKHMSSHTVLHLAVPNQGSWGARVRGWVSYQPYHLLYFNKSSLMEICERLELEIINLSTHESFSGWFLAAFRTVYSGRGFSNSVAVSGKPTVYRITLVHLYRLAMALCGLITFPFRWIQAKCGKGDELVVLLRIRAA